MAAPWPAGAEARIVGTLHGQDCINVIHFATNNEILDQPGLDALLLQLAEALADCVVNSLLPAVTSDYTFRYCDARRIWPEKSDPIVATANAGQTGDRGPTSVSFAATLVNKRTGGGGRRGRGKMFLPPPGEADITSSSLDPALVGILIPFLTCLAGKFLENATTPWRMGVYSPTNDAAVGGDFNNSFRVITQLTPSVDMAKIGSRRKRLGT
jgi:hypothetical protein